MKKTITFLTNHCKSSSSNESNYSQGSKLIIEALEIRNLLSICCSEMIISESLIYADVLDQTENEILQARDDYFTSTEDTPLIIDDLILNDTTGDNYTISVNQPRNGTLSLLDDGTYQYEPDQNYNGTDFFSYTLTDQNGNISEALVTISITSTEDSPIAVGKEYHYSDTIIMLNNITENDYDPDGDQISLVSIEQPLYGQIDIDKNTGEAYYFTTEPLTQTDSITYTITDTNGNTTQGILTIVPSQTTETPVINFGIIPLIFTDGNIDININPDDSFISFSPDIIPTVLPTDSTIAPIDGLFIPLTRLTPPPLNNIATTDSNISFDPAAIIPGMKAFDINPGSQPFAKDITTNGITNAPKGIVKFDKIDIPLVDNMNHSMPENRSQDHIGQPPHAHGENPDNIHPQMSPDSTQHTNSENKVHHTHSSSNDTPTNNFLNTVSNSHQLKELKYSAAQESAVNNISVTITDIHSNDYIERSDIRLTTIDNGIIDTSTNTNSNLESLEFTPVRITETGQQYISTSINNTDESTDNFAMPEEIDFTIITTTIGTVSAGAVIAQSTLSAAAAAKTSSVINIVDPSSIVSSLTSTGGISSINAITKININKLLK